MRCAVLLLLGAASATVLPAQTSMSGPVEAYSFDAPTHSLRKIIGSPGSASFGLAAVDELDFGSAAPGRNYAIAFRGGRCLLISGLDSHAVSTRVIAGVSAAPEGIVWSGDRFSAILFSRTANWIQTLSGFPDAPVAHDVVDVSPLGGSLSAVAANTQGSQIAIGISAGKGGVYLMKDHQAFTPVFQTANPAALSFSSDNATLLALDGASRQLFELNLGNLSFQTVPLDGLADPFAVGAVQDSQKRRLIYVASRSDRVLRIIDPAAAPALIDIPLAFAPTGLEDFGRNSLLLASRARDSDPLWLLSTSPRPAVYFVPAAVTPLWKVRRR